MNKILYKHEIEDELMIQFIIMYALRGADEPLAYSDMLNVIQGNCEISFTDLQIGLDNLVKTGHVSESKVSDILSVYDITKKGINVIDFFYAQIPLIVREPMDKSIKELFLEKRKREAVRADITPINREEFNAECSLYDDDRNLLMSLQLYAGERDEAERLAEYFKSNWEKIYTGIVDLFNDSEDE